jgi:hypothetical protein
MAQMEKHKRPLPEPWMQSNVSSFPISHVLLMPGEKNQSTSWYAKPPVLDV